MCTLKGVITCGIMLAVLDIIYGLITSGFYCYQFILDIFYMCPHDMPIKLCSNKMYIYKQMFEMRVFIGIAEGIVGVMFDILYIISLVKHKPSLTWVWLMKSFAVVGINVYYLASWYIRQGHFEHINADQIVDEGIFIHTAEGMTVAQVFIMTLFCVIGSVFTYKVCEERTASRRSLRMRKYSTDASSPRLDYDEEEAQYLNDALTNSDKTIPARVSKQSLTEISRADTFKHSTGV